MDKSLIDEAFLKEGFSADRMPVAGDADLIQGRAIESIKGLLKLKMEEGKSFSEARLDAIHTLTDPLVSTLGYAILQPTEIQKAWLEAKRIAGAKYLKDHEKIEDYE